MRAIRSGEEVIKMDDLIIDCFAGGGERVPNLLINESEEQLRFA